jgi:hypothetical protein
MEITLKESSSSAALLEQYKPTVELALSTVIDCDELYAVAVEQCREVKVALDGLKKKQTDSLANVKKVSDDIKAIYAPAIERLTAAETAIKKALSDYTTEQRRLADAEQERLRLLAEQERKNQAEAAEQARKNAEKLLAGARSAEEINVASEAVADAAALTQMVQSPSFAPVVTAPVLKAKGTTTRTIWSAEVADLKALVKHIAANVDLQPELLSYLTPCMPALNKIVQAHKKNLNLPGVKANDRPNVAISTK